MYVIKMMNKEKFKITEQEFRQLANVNGKVYVKSCDSLINTSMIECGYSESREKEVEQKKQQYGVLHDGHKVEKVFGKWKSCSNPDATIDANYYSEILEDRVMTPEEFENQKSIIKK